MLVSVITYVSVCVAAYDSSLYLCVVNSVALRASQDPLPTPRAIVAWGVEEGGIRGWGVEEGYGGKRVGGYRGEI